MGFSARHEIASVDLAVPDPGIDVAAGLARGSVDPPRDNPGLSAVCARDDLAVDRDRDHLLIDDNPLWAALA